MIRWWGEGMVFAALAVALHLAVFWAMAGGAGQTAGGAGGGSSITMVGATAEMTKMIADWDAVPDPDQNVVEMTPVRPEQSKDINANQMKPPVLIPAVAALEQPPASTAVIPQIETPAAATLPVPAPVLAQPHSIEAPSVTALTTRLADPTIPMAPTEAPQPKTAAPQIASDAIDPLALEIAKNAPAKAPAPQKKPSPPKREVAKAAAKPRSAAPKAASKTVTNGPLKTARLYDADGSSGAIAPASVAAGIGGGVKAGDGAAAKTVGLSASQRAVLEQIWGGKIRRSIERKKRFPFSTRRSGATQIAMTVGRSGRLIAASVKKGSGHEKLDRAAMNAVRAAAPFTPAPVELPQDSYRFVLQISFQR